MKYNPVIDGVEIVYENLKKRHFPNDYLDHIICGDCVTVMKSMPDECINLIITSPPYFVEKNYEKDWTWEKYSSLMKDVFAESHRLLKPCGYFVVNFGDYFNSGNRFYEAEVPSVYPASVPFFEWGSGAGYDLQATRIWRKDINRMSIPFVCNHHPRPVFDYEHIWTFRKKGDDNTEFVNNRKVSQKAVLGEGWQESANLKHHEASFPIDLPMWAIEIYSKSKSDVVLDPFLGFGTTMLACTIKGRRCIGIEIDEKYCTKAFCRCAGS